MFITLRPPVMLDVDVRKSNKISRKDADVCIISDPSALAAAFACAVTVLSEPECLVARNGDLSIFSAYRRIFPQARFELLCSTVMIKS